MAEPTDTASRPGRRPETLRTYIQLRKTEELVRLFRSDDRPGARAGVRAYIAQRVRAFRDNKLSFEVIELPSAALLEIDGKPVDTVDLLRSLSVVIEIRRDDAELLYRLSAEGSDEDLRFFGVDAPIFAGRSWSPGAANGRFFWDRAAAQRMIGTDALQAGSGAPLTGAGVNVVLMDSGLDAVERQQLGLTYGLTFKGSQHLTYLAETTPRQARYGHAWGIARQFTHLARDVTLHDFAILPPRLSRSTIPAMGVTVPAFVSDVVTGMALLHAHIQARRQAADQAPWVVVNAWSVFERTWLMGTDLDTPQSWLNWLIGQTVALDVDMVFAAGNCGLFGPDVRCGPEDLGPGCSIVGPNGHPDVLTVGAVRDDDIWLGYSSQGPGIMDNTRAAREKPDLCVPSEFRENDDAAVLNTGTSSACGVAGAVIAALRQANPDPSPAALKQVLVDTARKVAGPGWTPRLGHGVLDLGAATAELARQAAGQSGTPARRSASAQSPPRAEAPEGWRRR